MKKQNCRGFMSAQSAVVVSKRININSKVKFEFLVNSRK